MHDFTAYATLGLMLGLVLTRPRIGSRLRITPAMAGGAAVLILMGLGVVAPSDVTDALRELWRGLVGITSIMITAAVAHRMGALERLAAIIERGTQGPVHRAFLLVYVLSCLTAAVLNNDTAILLLSPTVAALIRRRYPYRPYLVVPFSFAVFAAAGVAPLVISNPMNLVVAEYAGIDFNAYALRMIPVAIVGWTVAYLVLARIFRKELDDAVPGRGPLSPPGKPISRAEWQAIALLAVVLGAYPVVSFLEGPVWIVAAIGALLAVALAWIHRAATPIDVGRVVSWDVLGFLIGVFVVAVGLRNVGLVGHITSLYASVEPGAGQIGVIGATSALGSALLNNHPTALLNALAIDGLAGDHRVPIFAALIGGDLGPRLLPSGSLAGLLWLECLRREGVTVTLRQFVGVGLALTGPSLLASLLTLRLIS